MKELLKEKGKEAQLESVDESEIPSSGNYHFHNLLHNITNPVIPVLDIKEKLKVAGGKTRPEPGLKGNSFKFDRLGYDVII